MPRHYQLKKRQDAPTDTSEDTPTATDDSGNTDATDAPTPTGKYLLV